MQLTIVRKLTSVHHIKLTTVTNKDVSLILVLIGKVFIIIAISCPHHPRHHQMILLPIRVLLVLVHALLSVYVRVSLAESI